MYSRLAAARPNRRAITPFKTLLVIFSIPALIAVAMALIKPDKHKWEVPHSEAETFLSNRPECPENWAGFPLWSEKIEKSNSNESAEFNTVGGVVVYTPPGGQLPLSGPQTNIPEFNDCQKLLSISDPSRFDSLAAIFVAYKVDSVTPGLGWHSLTWSSSSPSIATVDSDGLVTAITAGNVAITATSVTNPSLQKQAVVTVVPGPPGPAPLPPIYLDGTPSGPMTIGSSRYAVAEFGDESAPRAALATIYNYGPGYPTLGIGPNFSCLYVFFDNNSVLRAKMVQANVRTAAGHLCTDPVDVQAAPGKDLVVRRTAVNIPGQNAATLYPPVARWDWDPTTQKQYIGLACGNAWCEVGEAPFNPPPQAAFASSSIGAEQRVIRVKGWHDQQILAVVRPGGPGPVPSNLLGTVIPNPELKGQPWSQAGPAEWHLAAYVTLQDLNGNAVADFASYEDKLNVKEVPLGTPLEKANRISYCYGPKKLCVHEPELLVKECEEFYERIFFTVHRWWVRIDAANGSSKIFCLIRRSHPGYNINIPPTARWRWILSDDSMWTECVNGCCQTGGW
jgi:hypothetical protein